VRGVVLSPLAEGYFMTSRAYYVNELRIFFTRPFFVFQAEDGIRVLTVTGVQTCALPIFVGVRRTSAAMRPSPATESKPATAAGQIGRASCRERVWIPVVAGSLKKRNGGDTDAEPRNTEYMRFGDHGCRAHRIRGEARPSA